MRFLFDNNMPQPLSQALRTMSKPVVHVRDVSELGPKAPDPLIMQYAGVNGYMVISRDLEQAREPWFRPALLQHHAGYYLLRAAKINGVEPPAWELCEMVVKAWDDIERHASARPVPFLMLVKPNGRVVSYS